MFSIVSVTFWGWKGITLLSCQLNSVYSLGLLLFRQNLFTVCGAIVSFALVSCIASLMARSCRVCTAQSFL